jgi:transposase-like protein
MKISFDDDFADMNIDYKCIKFIYCEIPKFTCDVCCKSFKTENYLMVHLTTKAHQKNIKKFINKKYNIRLLKE